MIAVPTDADIERLAARGRPGYPNIALREALMLKWYGLVPYTGTGAWCPRRLVGKHCQSHTRRCACQVGGGSLGVFDHRRMWKDARTGELVMTGEPYRQCEPRRTTRINSLHEACEPIGVTVEVGGRSPYAYPHDDCDLIMLRKTARSAAHG